MRKATAMGSKQEKPFFSFSVHRPLGAVGAAVLLLTATGCQTTQGNGNFLKNTFASDDPCSNNARNIGIAAGTLVGAVAGHAIGGKGSAVVVGAGAGALVGGLIGNDIDHRRCQLSKLAKQYQMDIQVQEVQLAQGEQNASTQGLSVSVRESTVQFAVGSAKPTEAGREAFSAIAQTYRQANPQEKPQDAAARLGKMRLLLVGHTDDTGASAGNAQLSEARARAVAEIFAAKGFDRAQIFYQGAGETLPAASNAEEDGRARNRRVEILDLSDEAAFANYLASRRPNMAFYREAVAAPAASVAALPETAKQAAKHARAKASPKTAAKPPATERTQVAKSAVVEREAGAAPKNTGASTPAAPESAAKSPIANVVKPVAPGGVDFGGTAVNGRPTVVAVGGLQKKSSFSVLPVAHAADVAPLSSCLQDRPRVVRGVKSLRTDKLRTEDYLPGVYGSSWVATVNGHLVALNQVAVLRDGGVPARNPDLLIYRNYQGNANAKPEYRDAPEVNTYMGEKGLLYRVFSKGPVQCMDILIPHQQPRVAIAGNLIYPSSGDYFQVDFEPRLAK